MLTINEMPDNSRVWVYQCNRDLQDAEIAEINRKAAVFLMEWTSHGEWMKASITVLYHRFIVLAVDEEHARASGCGIDKSVRFIQQLEQDYGVSLFDRLMTAYRDEKGAIQTIRLPEFEKLASNGTVTADTIVFNNMVASKEELVTKWEVPMARSWHRRMLVKDTSGF